MKIAKEKQENYNDKEHKKTITRIGFEIQIPCHKFRFFIDRKTTYDNEHLDGENENGNRIENQSTQRYAPSS